MHGKGKSFTEEMREQYDLTASCCHKNIDYTLTYGRKI
jgi:hypothetical protein